MTQHYTANLELDHVFVFTDPKCSVAEKLIECGFAEGSAAKHQGQGTANRRFFFHNIYLEFIFVTDHLAVQSELVRPTRLWERSRFSESGASPFGMALRIQPARPSVTFESWNYQPEYLPNSKIIFANNKMSEPALFVFPPGTRPDTKPLSTREPLQHPNQIREVTTVTVFSPHANDLSPLLKQLVDLGEIRYIKNTTNLMELVFDNGCHSKSLDLRPEVPLVLRW